MLNENDAGALMPSLRVIETGYDPNYDIVGLIV
jgi:hypothetical protein